MMRRVPWLVLVACSTSAPLAWADAFDLYTNPILAKVPEAAGVQEVRQVTPDLMAEHNRVLPNVSSAFLVVKTNEGRWSKLLIQAARHKLGDSSKSQVPILLIDRFTTYREGEERAIQATGGNIFLFDGFHFSLDLGQVVPPSLGADLRFVASEGKVYLEPLGKAKAYLLTRPLPGAQPVKGGKVVVGEKFDPRYFTGKYKLYDDGRRSGTLVLEVQDGSNVAGWFYSDKDGRKYEVEGKVGSPLHAIVFVIQFPQTRQEFRGLMFTGDGAAIAGTAKLQERESGFYAVRLAE
ncbi:MAG: hypothetical protein NZ700_06355 [Gemmataceae bacterium]|nr:hypothetical protein [Gemmataceae bacterium]MDW8263771.1 hypothetical protein [Gemmataceae bacterium]